MSLNTYIELHFTSATNYTVLICFETPFIMFFGFQEMHGAYSNLPGLGFSYRREYKALTNSALLYNYNETTKYYS